MRSSKWKRHEENCSAPWDEKGPALIIVQLVYTRFLLRCYYFCPFFNEANIKVILFQLRVGIYSLYLVMLIKNIIFMYLSQRKYHFIKIQLDSDNICKDYWITAVWTWSALFYFHHPNKSNHNKQTKGFLLLISEVTDPLAFRTVFYVKNIPKILCFTDCCMSDLILENSYFLSHIYVIKYVYFVELMSLYKQFVYDKVNQHFHYYQNAA